MALSNVSDVSPWSQRPNPRVLLEEAEAPEDDGQHPLLAEQSPGYSRPVIQRSWYVWMQLEKRQSFGNICRFHQQLERANASATPAQLALSRRLDLEAVGGAPPESAYFALHWGHLFGASLAPPARAALALAAHQPYYPSLVPH